MDGKYKIKAKMGRIVAYQIPSGPAQGQLRPAIIVKAHNDDCADLRVFSGTGDGLDDCYLVTSVFQGLGYRMWRKPTYEE